MSKKVRIIKPLELAGATKAEFDSISWHEMKRNDVYKRVQNATFIGVIPAYDRIDGKRFVDGVRIAYKDEQGIFIINHFFLSKTKHTVGELYTDTIETTKTIKRKEKETKTK